MTKREEAIAGLFACRSGSISLRHYESIVKAFERAVRDEEAQACAEVAEAEWLKADNAPPGYRQNSISHGCLASAKAIRARIKGRKA